MIGWSYYMSHMIEKIILISFLITDAHNLYNSVTCELNICLKVFKKCKKKSNEKGFDINI